MSAGSLINIFSGGVRLADRGHSSKPCHGFTPTAVPAGQEVVVHFSGQITAFSGLTLGPVYLDVAGGFTYTPPAAATVVQQVGLVTAANVINFIPGIAVVLDGTPT
jgi:hypothetical protein